MRVYLMAERGCSDDESDKSEDWSPSGLSEEEEVEVLEVAEAVAAEVVLQTMMVMI